MLDKIKTQTKRLTYRIRTDYLTINNLVFLAALLIALNWTWNSVESMQQNYQLQQTVDRKKQQLIIEQLQVDTLELESRYYDTLEYQELAVRQRLGKGMPGESQLIVPSTDSGKPASQEPPRLTSRDNNFQEWMNFLVGKRTKGL